MARWGERVSEADGTLDRRAIGKIVFADPAERNALEGLVFPYIGERCRQEIARGQSDPTAKFVVLDAAVMLEAGWNNEVDRIVYVDAPRELRLARLAARSGWTDADLTAREAAQWPERGEEVTRRRGDRQRLPARTSCRHRWIDCCANGDVVPDVTLRKASLMVGSGSSSCQSVAGVQGARPRLPPTADLLPRRTDRVPAGEDFPCPIPSPIS